jgi:hypothetical protein
MDPFGFGKIITDKWDILMMSPGAFFAVLGFGFFLGLAITRAFLNERLTRQQMRIADLEKVLDGKLSASFLPPSPRKRSKQMSVGPVLIFAGIGAALVGAIIVTSNRSLPLTNQPPNAPVVPLPAQPPADAPSKSVLLSSRYYSAKNKEEVAAFLDKISDTINKPAEEMLLLAQQSLGGYLFNRPNEAQLYLQRMDEIKAIAAKIEASLYDDMLANEREYRQEMNARLFPKDPFIKFRVAVDAYRNGLSVWIKMRNSDDDKVRELQQLVAASQQSFASARDGFLMWLSQRQDIIGQTRRALRS